MSKNKKKNGRPKVRPKPKVVSSGSAKTSRAQGPTPGDPSPARSGGWAAIDHLGNVTAVWSVEEKQEAESAALSALRHAFRLAVIDANEIRFPHVDPLRGVEDLSPPMQVMHLSAVLERALAKLESEMRRTGA